MAVQARITATNLSFQALQSVFRPGRTQLQNIRASEYFRNGGIVSSMATNGKIADTGQLNLSLSQFVSARGSAWQYRETLTQAAGWGSPLTSTEPGMGFTNTDSVWVFDSIDRGNTGTNFFIKVGSGSSAGTTATVYDIGSGGIGYTISGGNFLAQTGNPSDPAYQPGWQTAINGAYHENQRSVICMLNRVVITRSGGPQSGGWSSDVTLTFPNTGSQCRVRAYRYNSVNYFLIAGLSTTAGGDTTIYWKRADSYVVGAAWSSFQVATGMVSGTFDFTVVGQWAILHGSNGHVFASDQAVSGTLFWGGVESARSAMGQYFINTVAYSSDSQIWIMAGQSGRMIRGVGSSLWSATWTEVGTSLRSNPLWQAAAFNGSYVNRVIAWGQGFIALGTYAEATAWSGDGITWYFGTGAEGQTVRSTLAGRPLQDVHYDSRLDRLYFWYQGGYYLRTDGRDLTFTANTGTTLVRPYPATALGGTGSQPPSIGSAYQGGYYVGRIVVDGLIYRLIVSPATDESLQVLRPSFTDVSTASTSLIDGWANTVAMQTASATPAIDYPAANYCRTRTTGGYTDWYLPSRDELELIYRNLKPAPGSNITGTSPGPLGPAQDGYPWGQNLNSLPQGNAYTQDSPQITAVTQFTLGNSQALYTNGFYWSSSRTHSQPAYAWAMTFQTGYQVWGTWPDVQNRVRPVRRVLDA